MSLNINEGGRARDDRQREPLEDNMGPGPGPEARPHINQHNHFFHFDGKGRRGPWLLTFTAYAEMFTRLSAFATRFGPASTCISLDADLKTLWIFVGFEVKYPPAFGKLFVDTS